MIQLSGAGKRYGHKLLFENTDWLITPESRIGLVGANGTGKSTVMKVLAGLESLDYGSGAQLCGTMDGGLAGDRVSVSCASNNIDKSCSYDSSTRSTMAQSSSRQRAVPSRSRKDLTSSRCCLTSWAWLLAATLPSST